jgi:SHS family lactate transporter-like MFS transporter
MTAFNSMSHGTQDNFPTFLQSQILLGYSKTDAVSVTTLLTVIANIGAIFPTGCATRFEQASGEVESGSRWRAGHFVSY